MALVVFLRGVNVGGHRRFRPTTLAAALAHLDAVNIGAAGTLVIRKRIGRAGLRAEIARRLPFDTGILIVPGSDVIGLSAGDYFVGHRPRPDIVQFVSVLARRPRVVPRLPVTLPARGPWLVKVLACDGRFVVGLHRRQMKAIGALGRLDRVFGSAATTRSWTTMAAIVRVLNMLDFGARVRRP